jgi:tRNA-specific 2-thiouridylase
MRASKKTVFVGISGGVDSSVAAYLLKQQGHEVHGIFVKTWSPEWLPCTWVDEKRDAMRVCATLDIPFHFLDATDAYKQGVADYMISEYRAGRTPNPDVLCNRVVKFGAMWQYAAAHGAEALATGHYARLLDGKLVQGIDASKDQSYFLWMLTNDDLAHAMFPIGHLQKSEVRAIAERAGLMTATKKDSQGICFLGEVDMREFLAHYIDEQPGDVVDVHGVKVGEHDGVWFHTLGERHGFRITKGGTDQKPYYVVGKDIEHNILIVSHDPKNTAVQNKEVTLVLRDTNWLEPFDSTTPCTGQIRYHGQQIPVTIIDETHMRLSYEGVVSLGQSLVLYRDSTLIGGGVIDQVL